MIKFSISRTPGHTFHGMITRRFGSVGPEGNRAVLTIGYQTRHFEWSFLLQLYTAGAALRRHVDGPSRVDTVALELWRPREGRLIAYGDHKSYLGGRVVIFNGAQPHEVTRCSGRRLSLLFQRAHLMSRD